MDDYTTVAQVGEIPAGEGITVSVQGRQIAILRDGDSYFALDDACPHMGASLGAGYVQDGAVYCPWHAWRFSVCDGTWLDSPKSKIKCGHYEVRIQGTDIQIRIPPREPAPPAEGSQT